MANVTLEDIRAAVQELDERGQRVSVATIRGQLGRGSVTTITKYWRDIRNQREVTPPEVTQEAHEALPDALIGQLSEISQKAAGEMYRALMAPVRAASEQDRAAREQERAEMREELDQVLADAGDIQERASQLGAELLESQQQITRLEARLESARDELGASVQRNTEERTREREHVAQMEALHKANIDSMADRMASSQDRLREAEDELRVCQAERVKFAAALAAAEKECALLRASVARDPAKPGENPKRKRKG